MPGKFILRRNSAQFHFVLVAGNAKVIATSEPYPTKAAALKGIESVRVNAPTARVEDKTGPLLKIKPPKVR